MKKNTLIAVLLALLVLILFSAYIISNIFLVGIFTLASIILNFYFRHKYVHYKINLGDMFLLKKDYLLSMAKEDYKYSLLLFGAFYGFYYQINNVLVGKSNFTVLIALNIIVFICLFFNDLIRRMKI